MASTENLGDELLNDSSLSYVKVQGCESECFRIDSDVR